MLDHNEPHVFAMGTCYCCDVPFTFNPHHVPSIPIGPDGRIVAGGRREPICSECFDKINARRKEAGLEPFVRFEDAYEPMPEAML